MIVEVSDGIFNCFFDKACLVLTVIREHFPGKKPQSRQKLIGKAIENSPIQRKTRYSSAMAIVIACVFSGDYEVLGVSDSRRKQWMARSEPGVENAYGGRIISGWIDAGKRVDVESYRLETKCKSWWQIYKANVSIT